MDKRRYLPISGLPTGWIFVLLLVLTCKGAWAADKTYSDLILCVDPLNMPYSEMGADPPGFDVEIGKAIGKLLKVPTTLFWQDTGTRGGISRALRQSIGEHKCNAFMGLPNEEEMVGELKEKGLVLTRPYMVASEVVVVGKHSPKITSIDDLAKLNTGVQLGTLGQGILIRKSFRRTFFRKPEEVLEALEKGEVDAALMFGSIVQYTIHQNFEGRVWVSKDFVPSMENRWNIAIAVRKEDTALKADIDNAIAELWKQKKIPEMLEHYGVYSVEPVVK